jgi:hypothetical protein
MGSALSQIREKKANKRAQAGQVHSAVNNSTNKKKNRDRNSVALTPPPPPKGTVEIRKLDLGCANETGEDTATDPSDRAVASCVSSVSCPHSAERTAAAATATRSTTPNTATNASSSSTTTLESARRYNTVTTLTCAASVAQTTYLASRQSTYASTNLSTMASTAAGSPLPLSPLYSASDPINVTNRPFVNTTTGLPTTLSSSAPFGNPPPSSLLLLPSSPIAINHHNHLLVGTPPDTTTGSETTRLVSKIIAQCHDDNSGLIAILGRRRSSGNDSESTFGASPVPTDYTGTSVADAVFTASDASHSLRTSQARGGGSSFSRSDSCDSASSGGGGGGAATSPAPPLCVTVLRASQERRCSLPPTRRYSQGSPSNTGMVEHS